MCFPHHMGHFGTCIKSSTLGNKRDIGNQNLIEFNNEMIPTCIKAGLRLYPMNGGSLTSVTMTTYSPMNTNN